MTDRADDLRIRLERGLRADDAWLAHVAEHGTLVHPEHGVTLGIPLTPDEHDEIATHTDRILAVARAVNEADLDCAAGMWTEPRVDGVLHVLLAAPSADERATVDRIVDGRPAVVDLVARSTRTLRDVDAAVHEASALADSVVDHGIDVSANVVHLRLRHDRDPAIPPALQSAVAAGALVIEYTELRAHDE